MLTVQDQVVLVTGANGGIGASVLTEFVESGATVIGSDKGARSGSKGGGIRATRHGVYPVRLGQQVR